MAKEPEAPEEPAEEEVPAAAASEEKASWFKRLSSRLGKTRKGLYDRVRSVVGLSGKLDEETIEEIEAILIQSDVAVETTQKIIDRMRAAMRSRDKEGSKESTVILDVFKEAIQDLIISGSTGFEPKRPEEGPYVVMIVGVNGVGKTTTIAKMAKRCTDVGLKTMLVAGDTFRAAAVEQLEEWARRIGCEFVKAAPNSDAAALCFDAMNKAKTREMDVVFIDTAGRLHTKSTLMAELGKIDRVIDKQLPGAPHETLLVIDATTGQNVIQQVKTFKAAVDISGLVMTKLDGTAKGGILITLLDMFKIPVTLIGVGEQAEDLRDFDPEQFAHALFADEPTK
ncbi:signal recognition particle-docking protein FtsY [bacterium]|nr:signal recognition particle-docking protein FtsY [bacterium]